MLRLIRESFNKLIILVSTTDVNGKNVLFHSKHPSKVTGCKWRDINSQRHKVLIEVLYRSVSVKRGVTCEKPEARADDSEERWVEGVVSWKLHLHTDDRLEHTTVNNIQGHGIPSALHKMFRGDVMCVTYTICCRYDGYASPFLIFGGQVWKANCVLIKVALSLLLDYDCSPECLFAGPVVLNLAEK